ncbi:unnamed protein product [Ectocarpus sp. 8 AP-2014]
MDTQKILDTINTHRRRHGAADLQWDATCATAAQNWANRGYVIHEQDGGRFGESLAVTDTNYDATTECINAINLWQQEGTLYDYENPAFSPATRHFTQNVWRRTTHVGFGFGSAVDQYGKYWVSYVVAKFFTPGNIVDQIEGNVLPPVSVSSATH